MASCKSCGRHWLIWGRRFESIRGNRYPVPPPGVIDRLGQPLGERPEIIEEQRVHCQTSEGGLDLNAVELAVSLRVFLDHCLNASSPRYRCPSPRIKNQLAPGAAPTLKTLSST
jgi:hypothetical protein